MKISVIIPTFNEEHVVGACLSSLAKVKGEFEVIVVDDGSHDDTLRVLNAFDSKKFKLTVLTQQHLGAGEARNLGATRAKGDIFVFVDSDMTFDPDFLKNLVQPIINKEAIGTFSKEEYVSNWDNTWAKCWNWNLNLPEKKRLPNDYPDTQKVFRAILKSEFEKVNGFSKGGYTDDWSLSEKLGKMALAAPKAIFYHENPDSLKEVFIQSRWSSKRKYKLGLIGAFIALVRVSFPYSFLLGILKSIKHNEPRFLIFKVIYDFGATLGIISYTLFNNGKK